MDEMWFGIAAWAAGVVSYAASVAVYFRSRPGEMYPLTRNVAREPWAARLLRFAGFLGVFSGGSFLGGLASSPWVGGGVVFAGFLPVIGAAWIGNRVRRTRLIEPRTQSLSEPPVSENQS
jgi:hypothetical protein